MSDLLPGRSQLQYSSEITSPIDTADDKGHAIAQRSESIAITGPLAPFFHFCTDTGAPVAAPVSVQKSTGESRDLAVASGRKSSQTCATGIEVCFH